MQQEEKPIRLDGYATPLARPLNYAHEDGDSPQRLLDFFMADVSNISYLQLLFLYFILFQHFSFISKQQLFTFENALHIVKNLILAFYNILNIHTLHMAGN